MSDTEFPLPPATFEFLTVSLKMQAELQLGLLNFGEEKDRPAPNFAMARHSIDMLAMLQEKTKGNLSMEEQRLIENSVTELRFRYIHEFERRASQGEPAAQLEDQERPNIEERGDVEQGKEQAAPPSHDPTG